MKSVEIKAGKKEGTQLVIVTGEKKDFDQAGWHARFDLKKGRAVWKKPVKIEAEANLVGAVPMRNLVMTQPGQPLGSAALSEEIVTVNVHDTLEDVEDLLHIGTLGFRGRYDKFATLVDETHHMPTIARVTLGRNWSSERRQKV